MTIERINFSPPKPQLDAQLLDALIDLWLCDCCLRIKPYTFDRYREKINYTRRWWELVGPTVNWVMEEETLRHFERWLREERTRAGEVLSYNTRKDALRRLRQVFAWAYRAGYLSKDYSDWVPAPSGSAPLRKAPALDALRRLIEACAQSPYPLRNQAIIAIMLGTGVRRAECAAINIEDVQLYADGTGTITIRAAKEVKGREVQQRLVAFDAATGVYIRTHLDALAKDGYTRGALFLSRRFDQERLTSMGIYKAVKQVIRLAGLETQIQGPHDLRRYFATYFSRSKRGEGFGHLLSKQMGHSTYRMTAVYSLQDVDDVREELVSIFALLEEEERRQGDEYPRGTRRAG